MAEQAATCATPLQYRSRFDPGSWRVILQQMVFQRLQCRAISRRGRMWRRLHCAADLLERQFAPDFENDGFPLLVGEAPKSSFRQFSHFIAFAGRTKPEFDRPFALCLCFVSFTSRG